MRDDTVEVVLMPKLTKIVRLHPSLLVEKVAHLLVECLLDFVAVKACSMILLDAA
jgi:hypothetical protein